MRSVTGHAKEVATRRIGGKGWRMGLLFQGLMEDPALLLEVLRLVAKERRKKCHRCEGGWREGGMVGKGEGGDAGSWPWGVEWGRG